MYTQHSSLPFRNAESDPRSSLQGLAEQLVEAGAGHFLFTLGQNSGRYAAPNATYDSIVGRVPSFLSTRDLMSDLYEALSRRGIKLLAYLPSGCPENDPLALQQFRYEEDKPRRRPFQQMWEAVIREWSVRSVGELCGGKDVSERLGDQHLQAIQWAGGS
jgi:hypothetical protein